MIETLKSTLRLRTVAVSRFMAVVCVVFLLPLAGCSSMKESPDTSDASFFQNPDRVWAAIQMSLDTLEYEIENSNRPDGEMRAVPIDGDSEPKIVLEIRQVAWTTDQVRVYVTPADGGSGEPATQTALDKAAADFLAVLKRKLGG